MDHQQTLETFYYQLNINLRSTRTREFERKNGCAREEDSRVSVSLARMTYPTRRNSFAPATQAK